MAGVINLWEAACAAGVQRMVYASSNHAVGLYPRTQVLDGREAPLPDSRYGERAFGMRIGRCCPEPTDARMLSHWIHPQDLASLIGVGLEAECVHEIVYGASANTRSWWNNSRAHALGYRPLHSADPFIAQLQGKCSADPIAEHYQGASFAAQEFDRVRGARL